MYRVRFVFLLIFHAHFFGKLQNNSIVTSTPSPSPSPSPRPTLTSSRLTSPQHNTDFPIEDEHCGVSAITPFTEALNKVWKIIGANEAKESLNRKKRVIGGNEARKNSWPWQVSVRRKGPDGVFRHQCGGTLVSRTKVISAAHCLAYSDDATDYEVQLGVHILSETNKGRLVKVSKIDLPSGDNARKLKFPYDIMVITLGQSVTYDDTISPACFGLANIELDKVVCYVTGWGKNVSDNSNITSDYLKQLRAPIHKQEDCKKYIGQGFDPDLMMCAGSLYGDSCQGDSGGPLVCNVDEKWRLYGVMSFGIKCTQPNSLTVYSKVLAHSHFLVDNIDTNRPIVYPPTPMPKITIPETSTLTNNLSLNDDQCGVPEFTPYTEALNVERIIRGNEARKNSWPWQVSVRRKGPDGVFRHQCSGTLVSRTKVISAANCLRFSEIATDYEVQLGVYILSETNKEGLSKVSKIDLPSGDNPRKQMYPSDIMVITLEEPVTYGDTISPVCFDFGNTDLLNAVCYVTGWGKNISYYSAVTSNYLKQTSKMFLLKEVRKIELPDISLGAPVHKQVDCQKYLMPDGLEFNSDLMMCAGSLAGDSDTCQGDSGGPLVCNVDKKWRLYGVVSFGKECAVRNSPTVYAKVKAHWKFLQEAMKS